MFNNDLYQLLSQNTNVLAVLGGQNYVWQGAIPKGQPTSPALVFQIVYNSTPYSADGAVNFHRKRVQFDSYSSTYAGSNTISETVRTLLQNITGSLGTTVVQGSFVQSEMDMPLEPGDTGMVFRRKLEIDFEYYDLQTPQPISPTLPAPPTGSNAAFIQGIPVSTTAPTSGQVLTYNATNLDWEPAPGGSGNLTSIDCGTF